MKNHKMKTLFNREETLLSKTEPYTDYELKMRELKKLIKLEETAFKLLSQQHRVKMAHMKAVIHNWQTYHIMTDNDYKTETKCIEAEAKIDPISKIPDIADIIANIPIPGASNTLLQHYKTLEYIQLNEVPNELLVNTEFMENIDTRIKYALGEYSKDNFIKLIYNQYKQKQKQKERNVIFETFLLEGVSLFEDIQDSHCCIESVAETIVLFDDLLMRSNDGLLNISKKYQCKMPTLTNTFYKA